MQSSLTVSGLLAMALGSAFTYALAVPRSITGPSKGSGYVVDVGRDWEALHNRFNTTRATRLDKRAGGPPSSLDYAGDWYATGNVGGETVQMLLDTGSADFWLVNPSAPSDATSGVQTWDPDTAVRTSLMPGYTFNIGYGQGGNGVSGNVYRTSVCVGVACTVMSVGSATHDQGLGNFPRSGIMGLAFQGGNSISPEKQPTFMEALQPTLDAPVFVTKLSSDAGASQIAFGNNPFAFVAPMQSIAIDKSSSAPYPYSWSFTGVQYFKNGQNIGSFDVVFDTGGPMTSAREDIVRAYYDGIPGAVDVHGDASSWTVPCGTQLPDLELHLGNALMIIPGYKFYNGNMATTGACTVWLIRENSATRGLVGDPFFNAHVVVFDQDAGTISWGNQA